MKNSLNIIFFVAFGFFASSFSFQHNKLSNVLLIINFNHPYYGNIDFLKRLYSHFFKKIVFYGEAEHPEVMKVKTEKGFFITQVLIDAVEKYPESDGYLFLEDDCILNIWNCLFLDLNKIWILPGFTNNPKKVEYNHQFHIANGITGEHASLWWWGNREFGFDQARSAFEALLPEDIKIAESNFGKGNMIGTAVDMFYIPSKYREKVLRIAPHFEHVFLEISIPCIISCLDHKNNWEKQVSILWRGYCKNPFKGIWPSQFTCVHPYKLSFTYLRAHLLEVFQYYFPEIKF